MKGDEDEEDLLIRKQLFLDLQDGLLETLKKELDQNRSTFLPISMITKVIGHAKRMQQNVLEGNKKRKAVVRN